MARDLLLMMGSTDECKQWITRMKKSIEESKRRPSTVDADPRKRLVRSTTVK
jgi:hypothetical protein